ncbi:MAG: hypothetical protein ACI87E_003080 [Mariniblastus sp.]|jgi:hypothetical protein
MYWFSIIVPMLGDRRLFDDTLASVLRNRPNNSQIVVVHDGAYEDPYGLKDEVDFIAADSPADLAGFFNTAFQATAGDLIAMIRPGVELAEGWNETVERSFDNADVGSVTPLLVSQSSPRLVAAVGVKKGLGFQRQIVGTHSKIASRRIRKLLPLGPTAWAAFYRASALEDVGPVGDQLDSVYLDLDLALSLKTLGYKNTVCPECVLQLNDDSGFNEEMSTAHGQSAQRAYRRHAAQSSTSSPLIPSACVFAMEVLAAPLKPWKLKHALQRLTAGRSAQADQAYAEHLTTQAKQRLSASMNGVLVHASNSEAVSPADAFQDRRAA